ncbi:41187_t:CDS:2, partial [Gigaspora margarita]
MTSINKIRTYNSIFSFVSVGVKLDRELADARAEVYTFCIQGSFYYRIRSLLPEPGFDSQYLQIYTWDTNNEIDYWFNVIPNMDIDPMIVQDLKNMLNENNLTNNTPTALQVAAIWINKDVLSNVKQKYTEQANKSITIDKIQNFVEAHWILASEAIWYNIFPAVIHLLIHLKNEHETTFHKDCDLNKVVETSKNQQTILTEYFKINTLDPEAKNYFYIEFPMYYTWNKITKIHGKTVANFNLSKFLPKEKIKSIPNILLEELNYNIASEDIDKVNTLNNIQHAVFEEIIKCIKQKYEMDANEAQTFTEYLLRIGNGTEP